ncbi:MAG: aminotransferase class IV [Anaerolineales bacterium]
MSIHAYQIKPNGNEILQVNASSLDELTATLPQSFYTTFSTLAEGTKVLGLKAHMQRLYVPASEAKLQPAVDEKTLRQRISLLIKENLPDESRVRLMMSKTKGDIYVGVQPFQPLPASVYEHGVKTITSAIARHDPRIKDTGFITESNSQRKLLSKDVFEILLTKNGKILEGMTSNFYVMKKDTLVTAQRGILLGITRTAILKLARGEGIAIEYRAPTLGETFSEAFLTSSSRGVVPIISIDNQPIGQGSVGKWARILSKAYQAYVQERSESIL